MSRLHTPKAGFWIRLCVVVVYPVAGGLFRTRWKRLDKMPDRGGVIVAINHLSIIDTLLMARLVWQTGRVPRFLIKSGVFDIAGLGKIMRGARQIPVYRGTQDASQSLGEAVQALAKGEAVVIYPEGTITRDAQGWPMQAKTGIARLVLLSPDTPVVPVGQWGAQHRRQLAWWRKLRRRTSLAAIGDSLDLSRYRGQEPTAETLREITDVIMGAIRDQVAELRDEPAPTAFHVPTRKYVDKARRSS